MPIKTWRSYATKIWKNSKNYFREYLRAETFGISGKAKHCYSNECSGEIKTQKEEKEVISCCSIPGGTPDAGAASAVEHNESVNLKPKICEMNLRPPVEIYEALDDEIEQHLKRVQNGNESKTRKRSKIPSGRSVSSKKRSVKSSSSGRSNGQKKVRSQENGKDGSSGKKA